MKTRKIAYVNQTFTLKGRTFHRGARYEVEKVEAGRTLFCSVDKVILKDFPNTWYSRSRFTIVDEICNQPNWSALSGDTSGVVKAKTQHIDKLLSWEAFKELAKVSTVAGFDHFCTQYILALRLTINATNANGRLTQISKVENYQKAHRVHCIDQPQQQDPNSFF